MKCLTVYQPHASLIAVGAKRYETRSRPAPKSLPPGSLLAIHAAARPPFPLDYHTEPGRSIAQAFVEDGTTIGKRVPMGEVLCVCRFVKCWPTDGADITAKECLFGDWSPGRWAWELVVLEVFEPPIPAQGRQGLWEWERPEEVAE